MLTLRTGSKLLGAAEHQHLVRAPPVGRMLVGTPAWRAHLDGGASCSQRTLQTHCRVGLE